MERNELTIAEKLKPGDRFYKKADKSKKVFEMTQPKVIPFRGESLQCCDVGTMDAKMHWSVKTQDFKTILKDVEVIYLRSNL